MPYYMQYLLVGIWPRNLNSKLECLSFQNWWKWKAVANTLAYHDTANIRSVKCFIVQALGPFKLIMTFGPFQIGLEYPSMSSRKKLER
jgi:hypothetical protein